MLASTAIDMLNRMYWRNPYLLLPLNTYQKMIRKTASKYSLLDSGYDRQRRKREDESHDARQTLSYFQTNPPDWVHHILRASLIKHNLNIIFISHSLNCTAILSLLYLCSVSCSNRYTSLLVLWPSKPKQSLNWQEPVLQWTLLLHSFRLSYLLAGEAPYVISSDHMQMFDL